MKVGVLALQGAFARHIDVLEDIGASGIEVRQPRDLADIERLVMPGGESTTMSKLLESSGLFEPLAEKIRSGMPVFGTCAGMILLAEQVLDGSDGQRSFGAIDIDVRRNAYGRQVDSFETTLDVVGLDSPMQAVFIRAPSVDRVSPDVEVLAMVGEQAVLARQGSTMVAAFHPELSDDRRLHQMFLD